MSLVQFFQLSMKCEVLKSFSSIINKLYWKNHPNLKLDAKELKYFCRILLSFRYNENPCRRLYWSIETTMRTRNHVIFSISIADSE